MNKKVSILLLSSILGSSVLNAGWLRKDQSATKMAKAKDWANGHPGLTVAVPAIAGGFLFAGVTGVKALIDWWNRDKDTKKADAGAEATASTQAATDTEAADVQQPLWRRFGRSFAMGAGAGAAFGTAASTYASGAFPGYRTVRGWLPEGWKTTACTWLGIKATEHVVAGTVAATGSYAKKAIEDQLEALKQADENGANAEQQAKKKATEGKKQNPSFAKTEQGAASTSTDVTEESEVEAPAAPKKSAPAARRELSAAAQQRIAELKRHISHNKNVLQSKQKGTKQYESYSKAITKQEAELAALQA